MDNYILYYDKLSGTPGKIITSVADVNGQTSAPLCDCLVRCVLIDVVVGRLIKT